MGNIVQLASNEPVTTSDLLRYAADAAPSFQVIPFAEKANDDDLYSFRAAMAPSETEQAPQREKPKSAALSILMLAALLLGLGLLAVLAFPLLRLLKPSVQYIDMGNRRFDAAGLGGRLIARWEGSAAYQLYIDPLDQQQIAEFQAVAQDPPHPLSVVIHLRDSSGLVTCQKEILFPAPAPPAAAADRSQRLQPQQPPSGDTVQYVAGADGQIAEIDVSGGLPCSLKAYQHFAGWDFSSNFPTVDGQADWLRHENGLTASRRPHAGAGAGGAFPQVQRLSAPIEGDDVIVGDNPSRGTVDTGSGQVFFVGANGLRNRAAEWQIFPAAIHFRCDKNGACTLTRVNSRTTLQARLLK